MRVAITVSHMLVRVLGVLLLILGILIWAEGAAGLIPWHMLIGLVFVIALIVLAAVSVRAGAPVGMATGAAVLAILVLVLGMTQTGLMPGGVHWVIQVLHLVLGMAAVGIGEAIGGRLRRIRLAGA